jgi:hypothetical protein
MRPSLWLAGTADGPDGQVVPNITPDPATGIGDWQNSDITELLKTGATPEQTGQGRDPRGHRRRPKRFE